MLGVNINNALLRGKARIFLLNALVVIERLRSVNLPLPLRLGSALRAWLLVSRSGHVIPNVGKLNRLEPTYPHHLVHTIHTAWSIF